MNSSSNWLPHATRRLFTDALNVECHFNRVSQRSQVVIDIEVGEDQLGCAKKSLAVAAPGVFTASDVFDIDRHFAGHTIQGQISSEHPFAVAIDVNGGTLKLSGGEFFYIEDTRAT